MKRLKVDLHVHCAEDPLDSIEHSAEQLIEAAAARGFDAISIANHHVITYSRRLELYGERHGILLIPGIEKLIEGKHVLLINADWDVHAIETFEELRRKRKDAWLVIAPHPYYPKPICLRSALNRHIDLFDAVEQSFFYTKQIDFNKKAIGVAARCGMPVVGSSDCHDLRDLGLTYTLVESEKSAQKILDAVKHGRIEVVTHPLVLRHLCGRGVRGVVGSLIEAIIEQAYGRLTGSLPFQARALANRCRKEQRKI